jgi:hypothetical protein
VAFGVQLTHCRQFTHLPKHVEEIVAVAIVWMHVEIRLVSVHGLAHAIASTGQPALIDQDIVFEVAHEHAGQHPGHCYLRQIVVSPDLECLGGVMALPGSAIGIAQAMVDLRDFNGAFQQVCTQVLDQSLQVRKQCLGINHDVPIVL